MHSGQLCCAVICQKAEIAAVTHIDLDVWWAGPNRPGGADVVETEAMQDVGRMCCTSCVSASSRCHRIADAMR